MSKVSEVSNRADRVDDAVGPSAPPVATHSTAAISVIDLHVHYPLRPFQRRSLKAALFRTDTAKSRSEQQIHAIRGVSFAVNVGERLGVIGGNGSGKSTLLRAIAGIYQASAGQVTVQGEIRSLLDLGSGLVVEDTGRNNIYHRGLLLGETRKRLAELEPAIIDFANLKDFIDLPMRTYSAGMLVRLAFSISCLVRGDILLIDEIFGAGDKAFTERAKNHVKQMVSTARSMVFVSHDLVAIQELCTHAIWLDQGIIKCRGTPADVAAEYLKFASHSGA